MSHIEDELPPDVVAVLREKEIARERVARLAESGITWASLGAANEAALLFYLQPAKADSLRDIIERDPSRRAILRQFLPEAKKANGNGQAHKPEAPEGAAQSQTRHGGNGEAQADGARAETDAVGAWPKPKPIIAELKPVPAFDAETLLPDCAARLDHGRSRADALPAGLHRGGGAGGAGLHHRGTLRHQAESVATVG